MQTKQYQIFFHGTCLNLTSYFFYQKISKYFNDFRNLNFAVTKVNPSNRNKKKNQTFFHGENSNQTSFPLVAILNTKIFQ